MSIPKTNLHPPFRFLRASHATFTSRDLAKSRTFYTEVIGLLVSDEDKDTLYLRGLEERAHHSLTIKRTQDEPACLRVGMREGAAIEARLRERSILTVALVTGAS